MLRFTCERLVRGKWENERDGWVYLESFLVHYRNLVEFLSKPQSKVKNQGDVRDIHITTIWELEGQEAPSWIDAVYAKAQSLWSKYGEASGERISIYFAALHHATN
jgi:hypothetical protein